MFNYEFTRYVVAGGTAFIVDAGLLYLLTEYGHIHYILAATCGFSCGTVTNYALSVTWVFPHRLIAARQLEFTLFTVIGLVGLAVNDLLIWWITAYLGFYYLSAKIIATGVGFLLNFSLRKIILFRAGT